MSVWEAVCEVHLRLARHSALKTELVKPLRLTTFEVAHGVADFPAGSLPFERVCRAQKLHAMVEHAFCLRVVEDAEAEL